MAEDEVAIVLSRDEALVLFDWLNRTDAQHNDLRDIVEDQAEQRALWNLTCLLGAMLETCGSARKGVPSRVIV